MGVGEGPEVCLCWLFCVGSKGIGTRAGTVDLQRLPQPQEGPKYPIPSNVGETGKTDYRWMNPDHRLRLTAKLFPSMISYIYSTETPSYPATLSARTAPPPRPPRMI